MLAFLLLEALGLEDSPVKCMYVYVYTYAGISDLG